MDQCLWFFEHQKISNISKFLFVLEKLLLKTTFSTTNTTYNEPVQCIVEKLGSNRIRIEVMARDNTFWPASIKDIDQKAEKMADEIGFFILDDISEDMILSEKGDQVTVYLKSPSLQDYGEFPFYPTYLKVTPKGNILN